MSRWLKKKQQHIFPWNPSFCHGILPPASAKAKFRRVFYVPGNHELWLSPSEAAISGIWGPRNREIEISTSQKDAEKLGT